MPCTKGQVSLRFDSPFQLRDDRSAVFGIEFVISSFFNELPSHRRSNEIDDVPINERIEKAYLGFILFTSNEYFHGAGTSLHFQPSYHPHSC